MEQLFTYKWEIIMDRSRKTPLIYSEEFKNAVLNAYPNNMKVKQMLDNNQYILGRFLENDSSNMISADTVLKMISAGQVIGLYNIAFDINEKSMLFGMWDKEVFLD